MKTQSINTLLMAITCIPICSHATTLQQAAQSALTYDSALLASKKTSEADKQKYWQGMSGMLPNVSLEGSWNRQEQPNRSYQSGVTSHNYDVRLRQPLFDMSKYAGWRKGEAITNTAEAQARQAEEKLLNAVANSYFAVLYQQEVLQAAQAASHNFKQQMEMLEAGLRNGQNTRTEVDEARANFAIAQAKEIEASSQLQLAGEAIRRLSGINPDTLEPVNFSCLNNPPYKSMSEAIRISQQSNTDIKIVVINHIFAIN